LRLAPRRFGDATPQVCLLPKIIPFAAVRTPCGRVVLLATKTRRVFPLSANPVFAEPASKNQHSNPIASSSERAAPAASFSRLNPNRPGPGMFLFTAAESCRAASD
jgi:hypothetical protein